MTVFVADGPDAGTPWHFGDPMREQRLLEQGEAMVDLSHRGVITVTGPDRLTWLHSLTTQYLLNLAPQQGVTTLVLSPHGHIEHALYGVDDGETFWAHTEPGAAAAAVEWLNRMRFMMRVEVADRSDAYAVVWTSRTGPEDHLARAGQDSLGGHELFVPRAQVAAVLAGSAPAGAWALEARRIAAGVPRIGVDSDHRTIPNELGLLGAAVHLEKGCYRGQETVARVHTLGRPPRRLVRLHLDGQQQRRMDCDHIRCERKRERVRQLQRRGQHRSGPDGDADDCRRNVHGLAGCRLDLHVFRQPHQLFVREKKG